MSRIPVHLRYLMGEDRKILSWTWIDRDGEQLFTPALMEAIFQGWRFSRRHRATCADPVPALPPRIFRSAKLKTQGEALGVLADGYLTEKGHVIGLLFNKISYEQFIDPRGARSW